jgi:hypothetical protein
MKKVKNGYFLQTVEDDRPENEIKNNRAVGGGRARARSVFPGFYQLMTWSGISYIVSDSIDPGVGYWALVLEETPINLP